MRSIPRSQNLALAALVAAVVIVTLDTTILNVAIPTIRNELHTSFESMQWVIAGYSLTLGSLLVIGGPVIGGWLTSDYSWRWGFRINVVVAPVAAIVALWALPADAERRTRPRIDLAGCVLLGTGLFSLVLGITKAPDSGWLTMLPAFVAAAGLLCAFVV